MIRLGFGAQRDLREPGFDRALNYLMCGNWQHAEAYIHAAEIILAADPQIGMNTAPGEWVLPMAPVDDREVDLRYTFYETMVIFLDLELV